MQPRTIDNYGGEFADAVPVEDPTVEQSADYANRANEDVAQLTRTGPKGWVHFVPTATAAPTTVTPSAGRSQWGTGGAQLPTVSKTATGRYTITWAASYTDTLGEVESVSISSANASAIGTTTAFAQVRTASANVVTVMVLNSSLADADVTGDTVRVEIF